MARRAIADCEARGVVPIVVGGSALYIRAIVDDFQFPGTDPAYAAAGRPQLEVLGPEGLHRRLADLDPEAAAQLLPGNSRRVVRALEVIELTGGRTRPSSPHIATCCPGWSRSAWTSTGRAWMCGSSSGSRRCGGPDWWRRSGASPGVGCAKG